MTRSPAENSSLLAEYQRRRSARQSAVAAFERRFSQLANLRLLLFAAAIGLAVASWGFALLSPFWLLVVGALFVVAMAVHEGVVRRRERARLAVAHYDAGLARLEHRWMAAKPAAPDGASLAGEDHVFAADLDLVGQGSLFQLLCQARTRAGEEALARWLLEPHRAGAGEAKTLWERLEARRSAVQELRDDVDLREDLALAGPALRAEVDPEALCAWGEAPTTLPQSRLLWWAIWLPSLGTPLTLGLALAGILPWWPFLLCAAVEAPLYKLLGKRLGKIVGGVDVAGRQLAVLASLLARLEALEVSSPRLRELHGRLSARGMSASASIAALQRRLNWLEAMKNAVFAPVGFITLWPLHFGGAVERWRLAAGPQIRVWLRTLGELEALCCLAGYAYEHPEDPFAELAEEGGALLQGEGLAHPLMPVEEAVANRISLAERAHEEGAAAGNGAAVWMVSGSNMSGKSTYLRTVGANVALALAGAPVRAERLRLSPLALGATLRIQDSLHDGRSRFFAEVRRLKQLADIAEADGPPLLFLLDELLHGTNSADRQTGARALIARYAECGAIGLVTTHDLALGEKSDGLTWLHNKHFADAITAAGQAAAEGGRAPLDEEDALRFDYTLRDGRLEGSNALELMRAVGLDV